MRTIDLSPLYRASVGFDRLFKTLDSVNRLEDSAFSYPPYNIEKVSEDAYRIVMAVAGFGEDLAVLKGVGAPRDLAERWNPILDVFKKEGVRFGLDEGHPAEVRRDSRECSRHRQGVVRNQPDRGHDGDLRLRLSDQLLEVGRRVAGHHDALVGRDDEDHEVDPPDAGQHRVHVVTGGRRGDRARDPPPRELAHEGGGPGDRHHAARGEPGVVLPLAARQPPGLLRVHGSAEQQRHRFLGRAADGQAPEVTGRRQTELAQELAQ